MTHLAFARASIAAMTLSVLSSSYELEAMEARAKAKCVIFDLFNNAYTYGVEKINDTEQYVMFDFGFGRMIMPQNKQPGDAASSSSNDDVFLDTQTELAIYGYKYAYKTRQGEALVSTNDKILDKNTRTRMSQIIRNYTSRISSACGQHGEYNDKSPKPKLKRELNEAYRHLLLALAESPFLLKHTNITTLKFSSFGISSYDHLDRILRNSKITTLLFDHVHELNLEELANILINTNITTLDLTTCDSRDCRGCGAVKNSV